MSQKIAKKLMFDQDLKYSEHFDTLIALVTYLGVGRFEEKDSKNIPSIAQHLNIEEEEVKFILNSFRGLFRKSEEKFYSTYGNQYRYTLLLRYSKRNYENSNLMQIGEPLKEKELFEIYKFISDLAQEEQRNIRTKITNRNTLIAAWIAAFFSFISVIISFLK